MTDNLIMKRIEFLDAIKGCVIILMVMGHAIAWNYGNWQDIVLYNISQSLDKKWGGVIWQLIYSFHMALFFLVSGFLTYRIKGLERIGVFLKKKIKRLFIPWVCTFGLIYAVRGSMGYWFVLSLFELSIAGYLLIRFLDRIKIKSFWLDALIMGIVWILIRNFSSAEICGVEIGKFTAYWLPFCCGILLHKYNKFYDFCAFRNWFFTLCIAAFMLIFISRYFCGSLKIVGVVYKYGGTVLPVIGSLCIWHIFVNLKNNFLLEKLSYLGQKTMPIYILHILFVIQIPLVGKFILAHNPVTSVTLQLSYSLLISLVAIFWSLVFYKILRKSEIISSALFGE